MKLRRNFSGKHNSGPCSDKNIFTDTRGVSTTDIIITVVAVIVIIISVIFLVMNMVNLRKINDEIDELKATVQQKQQTLNKLIELGRSEDVLLQQYDKNLLYIPSERDEVGITADVTGIIIDTEALFRKITFGDEKALENNIIDVPFTVRLECTYDKLIDIIDEMGTTNRLYIIESIVVVTSNTGTDVLSSDIKMHAYYRKN